MNMSRVYFIIGVALYLIGLAVLVISLLAGYDILILIGGIIIAIGIGLIIIAFYILIRGLEKIVKMIGVMKEVKKAT